MNWETVETILTVGGGIFAGVMLTCAWYETFVVPHVHIHYRRRRETRLREEQSRDVCGN
jgi:hypothetical protein